MSQIEVPDWVAELSLDALDSACINDAGSRVSWHGYTRDDRLEVIRAAITAALGAWVVPAAYQSRLFAIKTGNLVNDWRECEQSMYDAADGEPQSGATFRVEYRTLYTLRQEKPE